jgi:hypothetical protein
MRLTIILLVLAALATPAMAKKPSLVVVELVADSHTKPTDPALVAFTARLSARLRARAADAYSLVASKDDGTAARFCATKPPACWASIGDEAKADWMIYGRVEKVGDRFQVVVKLHQVSSKDHVKKAVFEAVPSSTSGDLVDLLAHQLYSKLHGEPVPQTR